MSKDKSYTFTVFTASYNRVNTLPRTYRSIQAQTFRDFEWIIVDDGSTDNTKELVEQWQKETDFPIIYLWQKNQGKHVAFNNGVKHARGEHFVNIDSDDECLPNALEIFISHWNRIPIEVRDEYYSVCVLCQYENGEIVGDMFPEDIIDGSIEDIRYKYKIDGDKWASRRVDILRQFPFPELNNAAYIPEATVWNKISKQYKHRFVNEVLRTYHQNNSPSSDQITRRKEKIYSKPNGHIQYYLSIINDDMAWFMHRPLLFVKHAIQYSRYSMHGNVPLLDQLKNTNSFFGKILVTSQYPFAILFYFKDIIQLKIFKKRYSLEKYAN